MTEEERKNGWTEAALARYVAERQKASARVINHDPDVRPPVKPRVQNDRYSPHRWRR